MSRSPTASVSAARTRASSSAARTEAAGRIRVGVGGWTYAPWRGAFYPPDLPHKRELEYASRHLTAIEVNGTFYRTQTRASFARWHAQTPAGFVFALKGPRYATYRRVLAEAGDAVMRFIASGVAALGEKLGPINWQFAPTKTFEPEDFAAFLRLLPRAVEGRRLRHAVEVRHPSFAVPEFVAMARALGVAIVTAVDCDYPQIADVTADFVYARIMGTNARDEAGYAPKALDRWAERCRVWAAGGEPADLARIGGEAERVARDVFLFVISGHKARNPAAAMGILQRLGL